MYLQKESWKKSFNRYMVECEYTLGVSILSALTVLIDTWWNVNMIQIQKIPNLFLVLIDTWWNVNMVLMDWQKALIEVLIDTWWNVNF